MSGGLSVWSVGDSGIMSSLEYLSPARPSLATGPILILARVPRTSLDRWGLDVWTLVGDDTFVRFLRGDVSITLGEIELSWRLGEGREDVGLVLATDDGCCVWPKSWLPARGAETPHRATKRFLGRAGVSGARPGGLHGVCAALGCSWEVASLARQPPLVASKPPSSETCDEGRARSLRLPKSTAPVSPSVRVRGSSSVLRCVDLVAGLETGGGP